MFLLGAEQEQRQQPVSECHPRGVSARSDLDNRSGRGAKAARLRLKHHQIPGFDARLERRGRGQLGVAFEAVGCAGLGELRWSSVEIPSGRLQIALRAMEINPIAVESHRRGVPVQFAAPHRKSIANLRQEPGFHRGTVDQDRKISRQRVRGGHASAIWQVPRHAKTGANSAIPATERVCRLVTARKLSG
jgi:hypothetical protein